MLPGSSRDIVNEVGHLSAELQSQLRQMDATLRKQWRFGQNIVLCWAPDPRGLLTIVVPHYFLGNFTMGSGDATLIKENEAFVRTVIGGSHLKTHPEIFAIAKRLGVSTSFIKLDKALGDDPKVLAAADAVIARYGLGYTEQRAVLLFDIAEFSLYTPFEQASQLNSLSYSMNSAYNKLQREGVDVNFARTTTGDGYYVWNRDIGPYPDLDLLSFLLIALMDNAVARREASGNTVPRIRAAYHIGSHYELFQAEGVNPTLFTYIVGDVTIKLARMLDKAAAGQVLFGEFAAELPERRGHFDANDFVRAARDELLSLTNLQVAGQALRGLDFCPASCGSDTPAEIRIVDKHGLEQHAANLHCEVTLGGETLVLGTPLV